MWPLYLGGFLGPFGGAMVNAMLPELASGLGTSVPTAATAVTWYMIPFSAFMLVSGTIGARYGITRAIRLAFLAYAAASLICVVATSPLPFLGGRMLQGAANAFTTPLLLALIAEIVPMQRLGRALGTFAAWGAAGQAFAPFVGGAAAGVDYRWAFGLSAVVALALAAVVSSRPLKAGASRSAHARWRACSTRASGWPLSPDSLVSSRPRRSCSSPPSWRPTASALSPPPAASSWPASVSPALRLAADWGDWPIGSVACAQG